MILNLVTKTFELADLKEDEISALSAISLANSILENVKDIG